MKDFGKHAELPLFLKAQEILETVTTIADLIPEDNIFLEEMRRHLRENALTIPAKIAGAEAVELWDIKMENAAVIRKCARELNVLYHTLQMFGFEEASYYKIVRRQIEEFRLLFREWVAGFNPKHFITDEWGLFNPPGIPQDYEQRDDELDFLDEDDESF